FFDGEGARDVPYAFNRKEHKDYGDTGSLIGAPLQGRVLIVDDVITAGTAVRESIAVIREHGAEPLGLVIAFDRMEWGTSQELSAVEEVKQQHGIEVIAVADVQDLVQYAASDSRYRKPVEQIREYTKRFGGQAS
ncbi:MAG: phosphoribosyltransferase family protein, partial [Gammaproteobacteria bacterium]|nr:phosphoribosyltransferase family protein [Gammaproteobacteria bacterium]